MLLANPGGAPLPPPPPPPQQDLIVSFLHTFPAKSARIRCQLPLQWDWSTAPKRETLDPPLYVIMRVLRITGSVYFHGSNL